jgi:hypothetical protein
MTALLVGLLPAFFARDRRTGLASLLPFKSSIQYVAFYNNAVPDSRKIETHYANGPGLGDP